MDSSSAQHHHQEMDSQTLESMLACTKSPQQDQKKPRPADMQSLKCPRCDSTNTKFCYYNNYSLSQPRYFCKSCRRYWTKGGTLRNVPVGGGCRKNKRSSSSSINSNSSSSSLNRNQDQLPMTSNPDPIPCLAAYDSNDLSLAIARLQKHGGQMGILDDHDFSIWGTMNPNMPQNSSCDVLIGNLLGMNTTNSHAGFLETPSSGNGIQNFYNYGMQGNSGSLDMEMSGGMGISGSQEMGIQFEEVQVKQEMCGGGESDRSKVLWGFPWQSVGGDGGNAMPECDSSRFASWNNGIVSSSNWQGLLNSPLM